MNEDVNENENEKMKKFLMYHYRRNMINTYKRNLEIVEGLLQEHKTFLNKLKKHIPEELLNNINYFDDQKYSYLRKKILDAGNEAVRDFEINTDCLDIRLK